MSTRVIKLKLLTQNELVKVETSARTLAEFKAESVVKGLDIDWSSAKLIDRASKVSFDLDESVLPAVDSLMFVTPTKTKSGVYGYKEAKQLVKEYKEKGGNVPFNYTHASTEQLNNFLTAVQTLEEVIEDIEDEEFIAVSEIAEVITNDELDAEARELKSKF